MLLNEELHSATNWCTVAAQNVFREIKVRISSLHL